MDGNCAKDQCQLSDFDDREVKPVRLFSGDGLPDGRVRLEYVFPLIGLELFDRERLGKLGQTKLA